MTLLVSREAGSDPEGSGDEGKERGPQEPCSCERFLQTPAVAAVLGFLIGAGLIAATAWSRTISASRDASDSIAVMMMFMMGGMLLASGVLDRLCVHCTERVPVLRAGALGWVCDRARRYQHRLVAAVARD